MRSVHFGRKPDRKRVCGSLNRTSQNHYVSEPNRTGAGQNHALTRLNGRACERSGKICRSSLSSIYGSPAHRSVPAPTTFRSRSAHAPLDFLNPAHRSAPLIWLFDPLRSRSSRSKAGGREGQGPISPYQQRASHYTCRIIFHLSQIDTRVILNFL